MRRRAPGVDTWVGWLLAACSLGCLVAAANWTSTTRALERTGAQHLTMVDDARERLHFWLFWAAVAAAGAAVVWLVRRGLDDRPGGADQGRDGEDEIPVIASHPVPGSPPGPATSVVRQRPPGADGLDWHRPVAPRPLHWLDRVRWLLGAGWVVVLVAAVVGGALSTPYAHLREEVRAGRVTEVTVAGQLRPGDGRVTQEVTWREGWVQRRVEVVQAEDGDVLDAGRAGAPPVLPDDVGRVLSSAAPALVVERVDRVEVVSASFLGWSLPFPRLMTAVLLLGALLTLVLIVNLPPPWRLTRWAWFWLGATPVGVLLFALLAGPTPGIPRPRHPERRLGGLAAFVLSLVLGPVLHWGSR